MVPRWTSRRCASGTPSGAWSPTHLLAAIGDGEGAGQVVRLRRIVGFGSAEVIPQSEYAADQLD